MKRALTIPTRKSKTQTENMTCFTLSTPLELGNKLSGELTQGIVKIKSHQNSLDPSVPG